MWITGFQKLTRCISLFKACRFYSIPKKNKLPSRPLWLVKEDEIDEVFMKGGSGPGGQKINKTNSKVQLTHLPSGIVVSCQYSRSQEQNRKKAREILALRLDDMLNPGKSRNAVVNERKTKVKQSKTKKSKRKYREIEGNKERSKNQEDPIDTKFIDADEEVDQLISQAKSKG